MGARADELVICVEGKYIWHNLEIQYASNQQQEKHKHFRRACVSPRGIRQWNNFVYWRTTLFTWERLNLSSTTDVEWKLSRSQKGHLSRSNT
jgi:hypothetical protein